MVFDKVNAACDPVPLKDCFTICPAPPVEASVIVSVEESVVMVMLLPAANVSVSELESATTFVWPETEIVVNESEAADPELSVPGTKLVPFHFSICPVDGALLVISTSDKSSILPPIVIVFVPPDPEAVTPDPTKFNIVAALDNALPSSCTVKVLPTVFGTKLLPFQTRACPEDGALVVVSTSLRASMLVELILANTLASV